GAADMVDVAMGQPDLLDGDAGLGDSLANVGHIAAGIDHDRLPGRLTPQDGAVLLERRDRHDDRAGLRLGLVLLAHGASMPIFRSAPSENICSRRLETRSPHPPCARLVNLPAVPAL